MTDNSEWLNDARDRLAKLEPPARRPNSIAAKVDVLRSDIQAARASGKSWSQIATAIGGGMPLNADAVRVAFVRSNAKAERPAPAKATSRVASATPRTPKPTLVSDKTPAGGESFRDMFGPMFDARDTIGRETKSSRGDAS